MQVLGLSIGARLSTRLLSKGPGHVLALLAKSAWVVSGCVVVFALAPNLAVALAANMVISGSLAILGQGILATLSLALPTRARSIGFSVGSLWLIPGLIVLPIPGAIRARYWPRQALLPRASHFWLCALVL